MTTDTSEAGIGNLIIDAHAHIYSTNENAYPPIADPLRPPAGTATIELLQREMRDAGVDRALLIQTYTFYGFDNRFIRDVSPNAKNWAGGVVNLDPTHPHSPDALHALVERSNIKGGSGVFRGVRLRCAWDLAFVPRSEPSWNTRERPAHPGACRQTRGFTQYLS